MISKYRFTSIIATAFFALSSCQTTTTSNSTVSRQNNDWRPLSYEEAVKLTTGYSYRIRGRHSEGEIYYIGQNGRFLLFNPNEEMTPPKYFDGGEIFKHVYPNHEVGNTVQPVDAICAYSQILGRNGKNCQTFIQRGDTIYLSGHEDYPLEFQRGYELIADEVVRRADAVGDTRILGLARRELPNSGAVAIAYANRTAFDARVQRLVAEQNAREEAERKARSSNSQASLGLLGWALTAGLGALQNASRQSGNYSTNTSSDTNSGTSDSSTSSGVARSSSGWVTVDGRTIGRVWSSYGYNISCSNGYKPGHGSNSAFGGSFKADVSNLNEATAVLLQSCKS